MKKLSKALLLVTLLTSYCLPSWAQASTEGTEFWVSSTIVCSPDSKAATPYIAVSAEKACTITIKGGEGNAINITQNVRAGSWNEFGNSSKAYQTDPNKGTINVQMDASKWYPMGITSADNVYSEAGKKHNYGLHITATEKVSVYVILSSPHSMDASNILPITAIQSEYYTQDYKPDANGFSKIVAMTTILATEDGTKVDIVPNGNTYDNHAKGVQYTVDLNKGQTYYMISEVNNQLTGTHIMARDKRKIAVFNGTPLTRLPNGLSARDCLFEQSMPVDYWGTQFIATRSLKKDGNIIGITATQPGTEIKVDGYTQVYINQGETYYILLQSANDPYTACLSKITSPIDQVVTADAIYIETSCPCAVFSYDTGNNFKGKDNTETNGSGDPSSVWVSPVQQKIGRITFGTCYTSMTKDHYLNVVAETATCQSTSLTAMYGATSINKTSLLQWQTVPGNPKYSYARANIGDASTSNYSVFRLENKDGFIAHIYGNGDDESYAYSAGSAAIEQGVQVNQETFTNGTMSSVSFCMNDELTFDALSGTDEISRIDWDFGDGTSVQNGEAKTTHQYTVPGWYDVRADLYGHQVCTEESNQYIGTVQFTFRVIRPDTLIADTVLCADEVPTFHFPKAPNNRTYTMQDESQDEIIRDTIPTGDYCDAVYILTIYAIGKRDSTVDLDQVLTKEQRRDSAWIPAGIDKTGEWVYDSGEYDRTYLRAGTKCDSVVTYSVTVISCLNIEMSNDSLEVCNGSPIDLPFVHKKGEIQTASLKCNGKTIDIPFSTDSHGAPISPFTLPTDAIDPGKYNASIVLSDPNCDNAQEFPLHLTIYYPEDVFTYQFNNVLAVWQKGFGGNTGWDFKAYQWFHNGELIPGATESIYHTTEPFTVGDSYYVLLTSRDGLELRSCEKIIDHVDIYEEPAQTSKVIRNRQMLIIHEGSVYNIYGQKVQ